MKLIKFISNKEVHKECEELLVSLKDDLDDSYNCTLYSVDSKDFTTKRSASKMVNDYAVTQLPFVLLVDDEGKEYAAIYSEEGPITIERIKDKL